MIPIMKKTKRGAKKLKALVVFYSRTGNTKKVAESFAKKFNAEIEEIVDLKKRKGIIGYLRSGKDAFLKMCTKIMKIINNPQDYDIIIIGTPVWALAVTPAIRAYLNTVNLRGKKIILFCTCGGSGISETFRQMEKLAKGASILGSLGLKACDMHNYEMKVGEFLKKLKL